MKTKKIVLKALLALTVSAFFFSGCRKDRDELDSDTGSSVDNAFAEAVYDDAGIMADQAALNGELDSYRSAGDESFLLSTCAIVTRDTVSSPRVLTIDFGTANCLCRDGRYRRGRVVVTYTGNYRDIGTVRTIGFDNYFVSDYQVLGTKTVTNQGINNAGHTWFSINVNGSVIAPGGAVFTRTSSRIREWIAGENTPVWNDDVYSITGSASGVNFSGNSYTAIIIAPLVKALNCRWIKSGILEYTPSGKKNRTVNFNYSNGNCDRYAELTIGTNTYIIELR
ncbi:MAG: hypothetical protein IPP71_16655 [Bacteroidetes bacterium]|nr:hypothetical protein [Bacteroidota bacterium]